MLNTALRLSGAASNIPSLTPSAIPDLSSQGPYNPAAALPTRLVKRILELEFVEISDITVDDEPPQAPGRPATPARLPVTDISQWLERFAVMAAILAWRFPEKAPELLAYQATIVRAEIMRASNGWHMIDNIDGRHWPARTLTGPFPTPAFIMKHLLGEPRP